jgi:anti-sigma28 factor (negative regulator of flagellin synthesis)
MDDTHKPHTGKRSRKNAAPPPAPEAALQPELVADPDVDPARREKIEKIKQALADGTYRISNEEVARKLIEHMREPKP